MGLDTTGELGDSITSFETLNEAVSESKKKITNCGYEVFLEKFVTEHMQK